MLAFGKPWSATDDAAVATDEFLRFFFLNQEHGVNNERSQSIQSIRHFKRTHWMLTTHEDRSARKNTRVSRS